MTDPDRAAGCVVVVLAPSASSPAVLVRADAVGGGRQLPVVATRAGPGGQDLLGALHRLLGPVTLLRANALEWDSAFDDTLLLAEVEPLTGPAPVGLAWTELDVRAAGEILPVQARETVTHWVAERDRGWSPLRPPWSRPGWTRRAEQWMHERMRANGLPDPGPASPVLLWGLSVVLTSASPAGRAFLKCSNAHFRHEAVLTARLGSRTPDLVPEVLAIEADEGWLLMGDLGDDQLGDRPATQWGAGLSAHAGLQQAWQDRTGPLVDAGAPLRPLDELAAWVRDLTSDEDVMRRMPADLRTAWDAATPDLAGCCLRLAEIGPAPTLVHGDLHPWNVMVTGSGVRIYDWTDAAVSHPFVDLVTYVPRAADEGTRRALLDTYLAHWADRLTPADLHHAGELALVVGSLYQVRSYRVLLPTVAPDDQGSLRDGDIHWMRRSLRRLEHGLAGDY